MSRLFAIALAFALVSPVAFSSDLPVTEKLAQKTGTKLEASIGETVFRVTRTSPLPNAFGRADIFGRTVDRGFRELRFQGISEGKLVFRLVDVETRSNETTMSRSGAVISSTTGTANTTGSAVASPSGGHVNVTGNSTTTYSGTTVTTRAPQGRTEALPPNTTEFQIDPATRKEMKLGSVRVRILGFDDLGLQYELETVAKE